MSKKSCSDYQKNINRLKGQLGGIEKMISEGRDATDIVTQISALRAGLSKLAITILKEESEGCFNIEERKARQEKFEELVSSFFRIT